MKTEYDGAGDLKARYTQSLGIDKPISMTRGSTTHYYHFDGLGSVTGLTDTNQNVTDTYIYDAFGNIIERTGSTPNPYTFTARESDPDSGLMYYRARYYYPAVGRFASRDPIAWVLNDPLVITKPGDPGLKDYLSNLGYIHPSVPHLYVYVENNPVNYTDLEGMQSAFPIVRGWVGSYFRIGFALTCMGLQTQHNAIKEWREAVRAGCEGARALGGPPWDWGPTQYNTAIICSMRGMFTW